MQLAPRSVAQTGLQRASWHRVKLSIARQLGASQQSLLSLPHKRRYSVALHCYGCSKRTVCFASRQGTQVALLSGSLPEATVSGCARAPSYQQLSRRLHWAAISIHGNCRACASGTHARHAVNASVYVSSPRDVVEGRTHTLCCCSAQLQCARGARAHARWICVSSKEVCRLQLRVAVLALPLWHWHWHWHWHCHCHWQCARAATHVQPGTAGTVVAKFKTREEPSTEVDGRLEACRVLHTGSTKLLQLACRLQEEELH